MKKTPMIHPDGKTLFFSSEGHATMGNFDIFYSKLQADSSWSEPVNMGYPINTPDDDFFFVPTVTESRAYMASSRFEENYGGSDLYMIEYEEPEIKRLAVIKGKLNAGREYTWDEVVIYVREKDKDDIIGEYKPNPVSGEYLLILEADKSYDITYGGKSIEPLTKPLNVTRDMTYQFIEKSYTIKDVAVNGLYPTKKTKVAIADTRSNQSTEGVVDTKNTDLNKLGKYTIQFVTLKKPLDHYSMYNLLDANKILVYKCEDGNYRYVYGSFKGFKEAKKVKEDVIKATGYSDPFVRYFWQLDKMKVEE